MQKEVQELERRIVALKVAQSAAHMEVEKKLTQILRDGGGPLGLIDNATEVRELLRVFDATASAK